MGLGVRCNEGQASTLEHIIQKLAKLDQSFNSVQTTVNTTNKTLSNFEQTVPSTHEQCTITKAKVKNLNVTVKSRYMDCEAELT